MTSPGNHPSDKTVTIAVIADTHANHLDELAPDLRSALLQTDFIIHLGDYTSHELLEELRSLSPIYAIAGNHDDPCLRQELADMEVIEVAGKRLGLIHGLTFPFGSHRRMKSWFKTHHPDAILYGHTHLALSKQLGKTFIFNPGTATGQFPAYRSSIGILTLDGSINGKIIHLKYTGQKPTLANRLRAIFIRRALRIIETWPYVDLLHYIAGMKPILKRFSTAAMRLFWLPQILRH